MNCSKCINKTICMFSDDAQGIQERVKEMNEQMRVNCPVSIKVTCSRYQDNQPNCGTTDFFKQQHRPLIHY